jgi:1-acyl-sn-glycerol-3-phosphate acyltransferase
VIYPQGTRVAPGVSMPYKIGTGLLYEQLGQPCIPVAANVGVFWPKRAILRKPGLAVVEFLDPIAPGLPKDQFMKLMSAAIEDRSNALMAEAGFRGGRDDVA